MEKRFPEMRGNEENEFECKIELKKKLTHSLNNNIKRKKNNQRRQQQ